MTEIRPAHAQDVPLLRPIVRAAYAPYLNRMDREPAPLLDDYDALVAAGQVWVAVDGSELVGLVVLRVEADVALLDNLAVHPDRHGTGVGGRLLTWSEDHAREAGCTELRLYTNVAMTENLAWYPRRGYTETGRDTVDGYDRVQFAKAL